MTDTETVLALTKMAVDSQPKWKSADPEGRAIEIWLMFCYFAEKADENFGGPAKAATAHD
jgi:hypothetical protein